MTTTEITTRDEEASRSRLRRQRLATSLSRYGVLIPFVIVAVACVVAVPNFFAGNNLSNLLVNASIAAIVGFGMTIVIASRGLDLSVGSIQGLSACLLTMTLGSAGLAAGVGVGLAIGLAVGLVNGYLVAYLRVPSFVATLGTLGVVRGIALLVTDGQTVTGDSNVLSTLANDKLIGIPIPFVLALVLLAVLHIVLQYTPFGRHVCAVGGSPEAAAESGIDVRRVTLAAFVIAGLTAGLGGVLLSGQLGNVTGNLGVGLELQIIAIAVLGGTSLAGGSGNLPGTFIAGLLLAMIASALNQLNVPSYYQSLAIGVLLIFALSLDSLRRQIYRRILMEG
ncbi:ABC transporter permease [Aeromicrobium sp. CFBP 8757]|uniref:ABC transporter permease n=1 Tax=Aeromicrobium sp. CFBP 8757 TaxID=2775288 RepID=UPI0017847B46|nr:ABC transporter permease [Aeromicrobium sp. CFBP 8757]MBD8605394.1 ABC transporter permease [Aeromicrobium sp. CFBP 8757]